MDKKYVLTDETKSVYGVTVYRIQAVKDFGEIKAGDVGGWVKGAQNLSQKGNCWVYDDAIVFEKARIKEDAKVSNSAIVHGEAIVRGNAEIRFQSVVCGKAEVSENAKVTGCAIVHGHAKVFGHATVCGNAEIYGRAEIFDNSIVRGVAEVYGGAVVCERAIVGGQAKICDIDISDTRDYIVIGPIGSRNDYITISAKHNYIATGCWHGTIEQFIESVKKKHEDNQYAQEYLSLIDWVFSNSKDYKSQLQELQKAYKSLLEEAKALYEYSPFASKMTVDEYFKHDNMLAK